MEVQTFRSIIRNSTPKVGSKVTAWDAKALGQRFSRETTSDPCPENNWIFLLRIDSLYNIFKNRNLKQEVPVKNPTTGRDFF